MKHECPKSIYVKLLMLMIHAKRTMHEVIERRELTPVQGTLVALLEPGQGRSMNGLSCMMGCDASNITGLVDRLEAHQLIERSVDPQDRRIKLIKLTKEGESCHHELLQGVKANEAIDLQKLTSEEVKVFGTIIDKLTADIKV